MDVRINEGEEIRITAVSHDGKEKHLRVLWKSVMFDGVEIKDGLSVDEIKEIENYCKIWAIKLYRGRTNVGLKEAKDAVDGWVKRNKCCETWPYCEHEKKAKGVDVNRVQYHDVGSLALAWSYPAVITTDQAHYLMKRKGIRPEDVGFWSFTQHASHTTWMSNGYAY